MLGDKAYDSNELRDELDQRGTRAVIPNRSNRKRHFRFNKRLYKLRWRIESAFNRLKDFRRIATRYDKAGAKLSGLGMSCRSSGLGGQPFHCIPSAHTQWLDQCRLTALDAVEYIG
jgi:transposase